MTEKVTLIVLEALKQATAEAAEQRLYRSGKLPGLFSGRTGTNAQAAAWALSEGLLEIVRTEVKGKVAMDWVRATPRGLQFVYEHESPIRALEELRGLLQPAHEGVPVWLAEMRCELQDLSARLANEATRWTHRLESLANRVDETMRRAEAAKVAQPASVPWSVLALSYLDQRRDGGVSGHCPLPELFAAVKERYSDLSMKAFHEGLRRLRDRSAVVLLPFAGNAAELPQPEFALPDGSDLLYYATR
jgi:hypothetical protein